MQPLTFFLSIFFLTSTIVSQASPKLDTLLIKDATHEGWQTFRVTDPTKNVLMEEGRLYKGKKEDLWRTYFDNHFIATITEYHD